MTPAGDRFGWFLRAVDWRWTPHLLLLLGLAVRLLALGSKSLWGDEAYSWYLAGEPWGDLWSGGGNDPHHPPLYYAILHLVLKVSDSEAALRMPSALASTLTVGVLYLTARRVASEKVALLAMALVALSPMDIWYAQDARQAAMGTLFITVAAYGMTRRDPLGWTVTATGLCLALFTYYVAALVWAACLGVVLILARRAELAKAWMLGTMLALAAFVPFQARHFIEGFADLQDTTAAPVVARIMDLVGSPVVMLIIAAVGAFVAGTALTLLSARNPRLTAWMLVAGFLAVTVYAPAPRLYTLKRILVVAWPLALILVSVAMFRWLSRSVAPTIVGAALALSLILSVLTVLAVPKDDWRTAVATINARAEPGDFTWVVVYTGPWGEGPYLYYDIDTPLVHQVDPDGFSSLAGSADGDIWIVASRTPRDPVPSSGPEEWLDREWTLVENHELHRLAVRRYITP